MVPKSQYNFTVDNDVYIWLQRIAPGFRARAINQACREASKKGNEWVMNLVLSKNTYQQDNKTDIH